MKKVLIALDYHPTAQKIAETGHELAKAMQSKTILLHITSDPAYYVTPGYSPVMGFESFSNLDLVQADAVAEIKKMAQDFLEKSKEHLGDKQIETVLKTGDFGESILNTAKELNVDMIVMGTHSRRGLEKILMGSVAEKVLRHSTTPVLIIPTKDFEKE